jgi:hypothetical protein
MIVAGCGNVELCKWLVEVTNVDINAVEEGPNVTALDYAVQKDRKEAGEYLRSHGAVCKRLKYKW